MSSPTSSYQPHSNSPLQALERRDTSQCIQLIREKLQINASNSEGDNVLHLAVKMGEVSVVEALISAKLLHELDLEGKDRLVPLLASRLRLDNSERSQKIAHCANLLLENGCSSSVDYLMQAALLACQKGYLTSLKNLIPKLRIAKCFLAETQAPDELNPKNYRFYDGRKDHYHIKKEQNFVLV